MEREPGTRRIPREDWGTLGKIRGITTPHLKNRIIKRVLPLPKNPQVSSNGFGCSFTCMNRRGLLLLLKLAMFQRENRILRVG